MKKSYLSLISSPFALSKPGPSDQCNPFLNRLKKGREKRKEVSQIQKLKCNSKNAFPKTHFFHSNMGVIAVDDLFVSNMSNGVPLDAVDTSKLLN